MVQSYQKRADDVERDEVRIGEYRCAAFLAGVIRMRIAHYLFIGAFHHYQLPRLTCCCPTQWHHNSAVTMISLQNGVSLHSFVSHPPFPFHSCPGLGLTPKFSQRGLGSAMSSPSGFGRSQTAKRFMVHFELKITPLVTRNQQSTPLIWVTTGILNWYCTQISKSSIVITDNLVNSWGVLPLRHTAPALVKSLGHWDTKTSEDRCLCNSAPTFIGK